MDCEELISVIRTELKRLRSLNEVSEEKYCASYELDVACGYEVALDDIESFLNSLPIMEKDISMIDLEKVKAYDEALKRAKKYYTPDSSNANLKAVIENIFPELKESEKKKFDPNSVNWIDLGLPSGRLWADKNAEGYYTYDEAVEKFGDCLPGITAMAELREFCEWEWNGDGYKVTGPNGNSITLPANGYFRDGETRGINDEGGYWTKTAYSPIYAHYLHLSWSLVGPANGLNRSTGLSVRPFLE